MKAAIAGANVPGKAKYWKIGLFRENPILIGISHSAQANEKVIIR
jgi:hypothetical protein